LQTIFSLILKDLLSDVLTYILKYEIKNAPVINCGEL